MAPLTASDIWLERALHGGSKEERMRRRGRLRSLPLNVKGRRSRSLLDAKNRSESRKIEQAAESPTDDVHSVGNAKSRFKSAWFVWVMPTARGLCRGRQRAISPSCGARKRIRTLASHGLSMRFTSSTGSAARRQWSPKGRTGKRSFSTAVDSTVEKEIHPSRE